MQGSTRGREGEDMICDQCGTTLTRWIKVIMPGGREYLFCCVEHLLDFFYEMKGGK